MDEVRVTKYELRVTTRRQLERNLGCELHAAWSATSQEWIADAHVARCGEGEGTRVVPKRWRTRVRTEVRNSRVGDERRQDRIGKVWMI